MVLTPIQNALMQTSRIWKELSYCKRRKVGCCIANNNVPISTGYNGTLSGKLNFCEEYEAFNSKEELDNSDSKIITCPKCLGVQESCEACNDLGSVKYIPKTQKFTHHAEFNAITQAHNLGIVLKNTSMYCTLSPCFECSKLISAVGITEVFYDEEYSNTEGLDYLRDCGIKVYRVS